MTLYSTARLLTVITLVVAASACGSSSPTAPDQSSVAYSQTDFTIGTGAEGTAGKTVTVQYADRRTVNVVVPVTDRTVEVRVPLAGVLRSVEVSKDDGTLAEIEK